MSDFHKIRFEQMSKTDGERFDREMKVYNKQVVAVYKELLDEGKEEKKEAEIKQKGALKKEEKKKELKEKKVAKKEKLEVWEEVQSKKGATSSVGGGWAEELVAGLLRRLHTGDWPSALACPAGVGDTWANFTPVLGDE